ncbi:VanZ family protein [Pseudoduganella flava]|uniref:VanZ family protein n=2 Tax=Pseudoduganella flava TaxID=871742 RepID=A0A562PCD5_9BURK|nr:VanZ family protein [Pseudoduganella flava]
MSEDERAGSAAAGTPAPMPAAHARPRRGSPVARAALLAYLLLIVYASWYPFSGWHNQGLSPLIFLEHTAMPRYWTMFDAVINVIGYVPFGMLIAYALHPRIRGIWGFLVAAVLGALVSGLMEAVQTYLPSRVSSNLDFYTNAAGCALGGLIGVLTARKLLDTSHLYRLRQHWFAPHASQGLVLMALWPLAQIYPTSFLFGQGQVLPILSEWLGELLEMDIDLLSYVRPDPELTVEQYWLSETMITACGMVGAALTLLCLTRRTAPRVLLAATLLVAAVCTKTLASALLFTPENAFAWITPGAQGGFLIGGIMVAGLAFAPQVAQRRLAIATILLSLVVVNSTPVNPYFSATMQAWVQGKFLNFNGAAQFLALLWPLCALWFLWLPSHQLNKP